MAIPASGPISMSMFNTELGRASTASDSRLANGSTPASPGLFWLANESGSLSQFAPHGMGEWYSYSVVAKYIANRYDCGFCDDLVDTIVVDSTGDALKVSRWYTDPGGFYACEIVSTGATGEVLVSLDPSTEKFGCAFLTCA
jgi:hypothetical protein